MRSVAGLVVGALVAAACSSSGAEPDSAVRTVPTVLSMPAVPVVSELELVERDDWASTFEDAGVVGSFALHRLGSERVEVHQAERASTRVLPASTFKILNSLIALETGVVGDVDEAVAWDGVQRPVPEWNTDHSLRTGIEVSAVSMYQELARRIGSDRMSAAVESAEYGNVDIGGPIDEFWLNGELRISPIEQLDLLARLLADDLPFDAAHQSAVRDILVREQGSDWAWGHKTGTALAVEPVLGWLVGYTINEGVQWVFAMNVDLGAVDDLGAQIDPRVRQTIARSILVEAGALPVAAG